jgi:hypothetical protein
MKSKAVGHESRVIFRSSIAGLFIAIGWLVLFSIPFAEWPHNIKYIVCLSFPAVVVTWGTGGMSGKTVILMFLLLPLTNALLYGLVAFVACRLLRRWPRA